MLLKDNMNGYKSYHYNFYTKHKGTITNKSRNETKRKGVMIIHSFAQMENWIWLLITFILRGWHLLLWSILPSGPLYFTSPTEDGTAVLRGHLSHAKVSPLALQREWLHFSVILRPWVLVRLRESNPRPPALLSTRSTDWANRYTRENVFFIYLSLFY